MRVNAVRKDDTGTITEYKLDNGKVIAHEDAVSMVKSGELQGYDVTVAKDGRESIRTKPDGDPSNNLSNLPTF